MGLSIVGVLLVIIFLMYIYIRDAETSRKIDRKAIIKENEIANLEKEKETEKKTFGLKLNHIKESFFNINDKFEDNKSVYAEHSLILRTPEHKISFDFEPKEPNLIIYYRAVTWKQYNYGGNYDFDVSVRLTLTNLTERENVLTEIKSWVLEANEKYGFQVDPFAENSDNRPVYLLDIEESKNYEGNNVVILGFNFGYGCSIDVSDSPEKITLFPPAQLNQDLIHQVYDYFWSTGYDKDFILRNFRGKDFSIKN